MDNRSEATGRKQFLDAEKADEEKYVEAEIARWIEAVLNDPIPAKDLGDLLHDGILLCRLMNTLKPGSMVRKIQKPWTKDAQRDNIQAFLDAARAYGVPEDKLFSVSDLHEKTGMPNVIETMICLGKAIYKHPEWEGPYLGPKPDQEEDDSEEANVSEMNKPKSEEDYITPEDMLTYCCNKIIEEIDTYVEQHLEKYQKYTLEPPSHSGAIDETTDFFNLISKLKDVSALGRRLLELAPRFNAQTRPYSSATTSPNLSLDRKSIISVLSDRQSNNTTSCRQFMIDEDTTSEDQLAALIESSSMDDFLVLSSSLDSITAKDMIRAALIYIKSHDCFTLSHDIQGVATCLRRAKFLILNVLAPKNQMELITRLLTSIGRYREMDYVFDLFRDRNQFEVLLSKGVKKTPELQIALFNYVKRNPEFYQLVTLNFSMFSEIGESLEASAMKRLSKTISAANNNNNNNSSTSNCRKQQQQHSTGPPEPGGPIAMSNEPSSSSSHSSSCSAAAAAADKASSLIVSSNSNNSKKHVLIYPREALNSCLLELVDAADCYAKAGCYKKSNHCARMAKLLALQLALLASPPSLDGGGGGGGTNVLGLEQSDLSDLIISFKSFNEAFIVAEAYNFHLAWRQALFKNVILEGRLVYLQNFCKRCDLSQALIEELVATYKKYTKSHQLSREESANLAQAMEQLLVRLPNIELRCRICLQVGLAGAKEELLRNPAVEAHLKDLKLA